MRCEAEFKYETSGAKLSNNPPRSLSMASSDGVSSSAAFQGAPTEPDTGFSTQNLELMSIIGQREHCLINPEHIQLQPQRRLGSGSFGIVVQGTFVGTPIAVKLRKQLRDSQVCQGAR